MDNNSINPNEVATLSLLGGGYGGYGRRGTYANTATLQHGLECNRQMSENATDSLRNLYEMGQAGIINSFENATHDRQFANLRDGQVDAERRISDQIRDQDKTIEANARAAAECCCALKLQMCEDKSAILAVIAAQGAKTTERELDKAEREIVYLKTLLHPHA